MWISEYQPRKRWRWTARCTACVALLSAWIAVAAPSARPAMGLYQVQEVKPKLFVWIPEDVIDQDGDPQYCRAGTAGFVLTSDGVVVVDTSNSPFHARELLYEIRERTEMPIKYVINTSAAGDHMLGNEVFTDQQATLISTTAAREDMRKYGEELTVRLRTEDGWRLQTRMRGFHLTPATQTFEKEMNLTVGEHELRIVSIPQDKPNSEHAVVYFPAEKILFLGELYENHFFPRMGARNIRQWIELLRQLETWDVDTYVPGHGVPGNKKDLADFRKFLEWLTAQVEMRLKKGKSVAEVEKELVLPKVYNWHAPELAAEDVEEVFRQLSPPPPPSADPHTAPAGTVFITPPDNR